MPVVDLPTNRLGFPTPAALRSILQLTQNILSGHTVASLSVNTTFSTCLAWCVENILHFYYRVAVFGNIFYFGDACTDRLLSQYLKCIFVFDVGSLISYVLDVIVLFGLD